MSNIETYTSGLLAIDVEENGSEITVTFRGKSADREPGIFITPILTEVLQNGRKFSKSIIMEFKELEYMNSSTITPIIKILENAKSGDGKISITYSRSKKWQDLCFSALKIFATKDHRIEITGN